jgi:hypothetical protein
MDYPMVMLTKELRVVTPPEIYPSWERAGMKSAGGCGCCSV